MAPRFESFKSAVVGRGRARAAGSARSESCRSSPGSSCSRRSAPCSRWIAIDGWRSRLSALERRRPPRPRVRVVRERRRAPRRVDPAEALAAPDRRARRSRRSAGTRSAGTCTDFPRLAGGAAGDARAVGALPRLRDRVRDRRPRPPGGPPRDARGDGAGELDLLDLRPRRPRRRRVGDVDRRPRLRLRLRPGPTLLRLGWRSAAASRAGEAAEAAVAAGGLASARAALRAFPRRRYG